MTEISQTLVLISEIEQAISVLEKIDAFYQDYLQRCRPAQSRLTEQAIVIADSIASYYTCLETVFLRVSRFFENRLTQDKWHQDLLNKMTLEISGVRERLLRPETAALLSELLKFRHFKRYYFQFDYDWDRIEFIQKKYAQLQPLLRQDIQRFLEFLQRLAAGATADNNPANP